MDSSRRIFASGLGAEAGFDLRQRFDSRTLAMAIGAAATSWHPKNSHQSTQTLLDLIDEARQRLSFYAKRFLDLAQAPGSHDDKLAVRAKAALELAPFVIGSQYLLHAVAGNWNNDSECALTALRIHAVDVGAGQPGASRIDRYQEVLRSYALADAGMDLRHTAEEPRISAGAFTFPAALIVLCHFPESLTGQILGANLYLRHCRLLPASSFVAQDDADVCRLLDLGLNPVDGDDTPRKDALTASVIHAQEHGRANGIEAIVAGFLWARNHVEAMHDRLAAVLNAWLDPREAARCLISRRRRDALAYHQSVSLDGHPMRELLSAGNDCEFLDRLASSPYVHHGNPELSPLLNGLVSPRGKMFRIFSRDDVGTLTRWISGLPYERDPADIPAYRIWPDQGGFPSRTDPAPVPVTLRLTARQAYPRLLHGEISPQEMAFARGYIDQWLARAKRGVTKDACPLPARWVPGGLPTWLREQHEAANRMATATDEIASREEVVADIFALAPLTMIDGAWLVGHSHPAMVSTATGYALFGTFFDELGNGIRTLNHPVIYRDLLRAVHGELPATADVGFAAAPCFGDRDFELPVFWLSIGRFPQTYQAEILGLNLAMELSGVGGGYLHTQRALKTYGFPTLFVDLHNTIDNIATGHSAWAAASIDAFMSARPDHDHSPAWDRVRAGFLALNPPRAHSTIQNVREKVKSLL